MRVPELHINQIWAQIGIHKNEPPVQIRQKQAQLFIDQKIDEVIQIRTSQSSLHIDQSEAFADAHLKSPLRYAKEFYQKMIPAVHTYISKKVNQGKQLQAIHLYTNPIANIARHETVKATPSSQIAYMPKSLDRVKFHYQPSEVHIQAPDGYVDIHVQKHDPQIHIQKWQADVYVRQKNAISFHVQDQAVNRAL
ncbi:DUF6470 family protein [Alkalihalobacillus pseudalcaliphilus]|uniref:DUF6470 family protein n=1 Tax=Alkalihalobacillus pseudalcaliphilus TaxID=79884 RepID=UPI00064D8900|nr:DUF6470 family protein [Alkalihalobacillus pseudalcaliphilus]KMK77428.1 hypothetical protein AB990_02835 [Alkalihalobacillus pseudalcaliphilus]